jgi:hypothetical protein
MPAQGESGEAMAQATNSPLAAELAAFDARRAELEKTYPMKFVVFKGDEFVGAWDTLDAAASQAAIRFGRGPYLIRQVGAPRPTLPASVLWRNTALA